MIKAYFDCQNCHTTFSIANEYLLKKDDVVCPSCGCKVPSDVFTNLKLGIEAISKAQKSQTVKAQSSPDFVSFKLQSSDT